MLINEETKKIVQNRYETAKKSGEKSIILNEEKFGGIELFINEQPKYSLAKLTVEEDTLYLGSNTLIKTS